MPTRRRKCDDVHLQNILVVQQDLAFGAGSRIVSFIRFSVRRNVDLPQPDGPMRAVTLLAYTSRLISCSA